MPTSHILVVDDTPINFLAIEPVIQQCGYSAVFAANGREAIAQYLQADCKLVLLDLRMPVLDGLATTRVIRALEQQTDWRSGLPLRVPIVVMSACREDRRAAIEAGCDEFLAKPIERETLARVLGKYLGQPAMSMYSTVNCRLSRPW